MIKVTFLYGHPKDPAAFEKHIVEVHNPLASKVKGIRRVETAKTVGPDAKYYRIHELWFDDVDAMQASLGSPEGAATKADVANFATGGVTVLVSEIEGHH